MTHRLPILAVALVLAATLPLGAADPKPPATVADLAWISGHWQGTKDGDRLEEQWSAPAAGTMMGMFRWIKADKTQMYEFLAIENGPQGPVLLLRHFNPGSIGWEEKDAPIRCPIAGGGPREAVFACEGRPTRLIFRSSGAGSLTVLLERQKDGQTRTDEFAYTRVR